MARDLACSVQKISRLDSQSKFQMFTLFTGTYLESSRERLSVKYTKDMGHEIHCFRSHFRTACLFVMPE